MKKTLLQLGCTLLVFVFILSSCKKENFTPTTNSQTPPPEPTSHNYNDPLNEFVIAQNYIIEVMNIALTSALFTPEMHGVNSGTVAETRTCPTVNATTGSPNTLVFDFGPTGCSFNHPLGGTSSVISGLITLEAYGPITDPNTNTFLVFDEITVNDQIIRFVAGNKAADWVKVQFIGSVASGNFSFQAKVDGTVDADCDGYADPYFDPVARSHFEVINTTTGDSTSLYPFYSGSGPLFGPAFTFNFENAAGTAPEFTYESLVNGCYNIDINPIKGFYHDNTGTLIEDYNIIKDDNNPLIYKPTCRWIQGGKLLYDDIPTGSGTDPNYSDVINNPIKEVTYGIDAGGNPTANQCDGWVLVEGCDFLGSMGICESGATSSFFECP